MHVEVKRTFLAHVHRFSQFGTSHPLPRPHPRPRPRRLPSPFRPQLRLPHRPQRNHQLLIYRAPLLLYPLHRRHPPLARPNSRNVKAALAVREMGDRH